MEQVKFIIGGVLRFFGNFRGRYPDLGVRAYARTPKSGLLSLRLRAANGGKVWRTCAELIEAVRKYPYP
jgi:hypothetical protein